MDWYLFCSWIALCCNSTEPVRQLPIPLCWVVLKSDFRQLPLNFSFSKAEAKNLWAKYTPTVGITWKLFKTQRNKNTFERSRKITRGLNHLSDGTIEHDWHNTPYSRSTNHDTGTGSKTYCRTSQRAGVSLQDTDTRHRFKRGRILCPVDSTVC